MCEESGQNNSTGIKKESCCYKLKKWAESVSRSVVFWVCVVLLPFALPILLTLLLVLIVETGKSVGLERFDLIALAAIGACLILGVVRMVTRSIERIILGG